MREIEFRAWDSQLHLMFGFPEVVSLIGEQVTLQYQNKKSRRFTLLQFTGLHDKNGKEIYEGDILRQTLIDDSPIGLVEYDTDLATFAVRYKKSDGSGDGLCNVVAFGGKEIEIIGNIYENPELLGREQ